MNAIEVHNVSKKYILHREKPTLLKDLFLRPFKRHETIEEFWALKDVNFEIKKGETVGIIGENGAGKSTMLKILTGVTRPTTGTIRIKGRISALLELGTGFHPDLTGRENIYLNGSILGLSKREIDAKFKEIVDFAELWEFIDTPVKHYSSGMYVRLGFAVATRANPEILFVDEVLAVGDARFQRKCYAMFEEFRKANIAILFISHSMDVINLLCDKAILLDKGQIIGQGETKYVTGLYHKMLFGEETELKEKTVIKAGSKSIKKMEKSPGSEFKQNGISEIGKMKQLVPQNPTFFDDNSKPDEMRYGDKKAEIIDFGILDENNMGVNLLKTGENYTVFVRTLFHEDLDDISIGCHIRTVEGIVLFGTTTYLQDIVVAPQKRGDLLEAQFHVTMWLAPGEYFLSFGIRGLHSPTFYDRRIDVFHFKVAGNCKIITGSIVDLNPEVIIKTDLKSYPEH